MKTSEHVKEIKELVNGYKATYIITAAAQTGLFDHISDQYKSVDALAEEMGVNKSKLQPLLNALTHYHLLEKENEMFCIGEYKDVLSPDSPSCQLGYIAHATNMAEKWRNLESALRKTDTSIENFNSVTGGDKESTRAFLQAMNANAIPQSRFLIESFDFTDHKFIDIGAGYGTYSVAVAKKYVTSKGVALDLPLAAEIIAENVEREGVSSNVQVIAGSYKTDLPQDSFDDAFLFAIVHQENNDEAESLIKDVYGRLNKGGRLFLTSFFLDDTRTEPEFSVLFGVEMLVASEKGRVYTHSEIQGILKRVGFTTVERHDEMPGPSTLYLAVK